MGRAGLQHVPAIDLQILNGIVRCRHGNGIPGRGHRGQEFGGRLAGPLQDDVGSVQKQVRAEQIGPRWQVDGPACGRLGGDGRLDGRRIIRDAVPSGPVVQDVDGRWQHTALQFLQKGTEGVLRKRTLADFTGALTEPKRHPPSEKHHESPNSSCRLGSTGPSEGKWAIGCVTSRYVAEGKCPGVVASPWSFPPGR